MPEVSVHASWQTTAGSNGRIANDALPDVAFVEPMLRRRLSRLSRMLLSTAESCRRGQVVSRYIWANRHGEIHTTAQLLSQLACGDALSPMGFSLSVHNTAAGLYSIARGDKAPATAIAAGSDTLLAALHEAFALLAVEGRDVMLVYAEEALPSMYQTFQRSEAPAFALALHLVASDTDAKESFTVCDAEADGDDSELSIGLSLLHALSGFVAVQWQGAGRKICWQHSASDEK